MFNSAYAPVSQPPNHKTPPLTITYIGWSMAHFPQRSQPRSSSTVSSDPLWGLHAVEHKADIQTVKQPRSFWQSSGEHRINHHLQFLTHSHHWPNMALIAHIFHLIIVFITRNVHEFTTLMKTSTSDCDKPPSLCFFLTEEPALIVLTTQLGWTVN